MNMQVREMTDAMAQLCNDQTMHVPSEHDTEWVVQLPSFAIMTSGEHCQECLSILWHA